MDTRNDLSPQEFERQFLEGMRAQYEGEGYTFTISPNPSLLPDFLGSYRPDAIAQKADQKVAIEVKTRQSQSVTASLEALRRLFIGHPDWQFKVVYAGTGPVQGLELSSASVDEISRHIDRVESLSKSGEHRAAFVLAWSLLEASLRAVDTEAPPIARTPGTVVQTLAMNGYVDREVEPSLRSLIELRNRTVHGDLNTQVSQEQVDIVLDAVRTVIASVPPSGVN